MLNASGIVEATKPEATFVIFPKITNGLDSDTFVKQALEKGKVAIVPGTDRWFGPGANGHIRICFLLLQKYYKKEFQELLKLLDIL